MSVSVEEQFEQKGPLEGLIIIEQSTQGCTKVPIALKFHTSNPNSIRSECSIIVISFKTLFHSLEHQKIMNERHVKTTLI